MIQYWVKGFWNYLSFSMQMVLMVVAGFSVACSPIGQRVLRSLAALPRSPRRAILFITFLVAVVSWIYWGLGMVLGIFLAREMGRRIRGIDYPLLVACAYIGMCAGSFGLLNPEALAFSRPGHFLEKTVGLVPSTLTSRSTMVLAGFWLGTLGVILLLMLICPEEREATGPDEAVLRRFDEEDRAEENSLARERELRQRKPLTFGIWLEHSRWPVWLICAIGFSYIVFWFYAWGLQIDLLILNWILLFLALSLHDTPMGFLQSMERSTRAAYGIIVQFPFYAGIQGMLASSGLAAILWGWMTRGASEWTYPFWVYWNGAVVNFFVPTSTGIWEIQGPLVVKFAQDLNVSIARALNAFSAGELMGNVIQPFWAIPLLAICAMPLRAIMGYCLIAFFVLSAIWIVCLTLLPL